MTDPPRPAVAKLSHGSAPVRHSPAGARPSRRGTNTQHPGDLIEAEPPLMMEQQRFGLIRGQRRNTSVDLLPGAEPVSLRKDGQFRQFLPGLMDFRPAPARLPMHH